MGKHTINQWHTGPVRTACADSIEIPVQERGSANLKALLHDLRGKLIHTVINGPVNDMLNGTILVVGSTVFADMLDTPVAELAVGEHVDFRDNLFNGRPLARIVSMLPNVKTWDKFFDPAIQARPHGMNSPFLPQRNFQRYSELPSCLSLPERHHPTFRGVPR